MVQEVQKQADFYKQPNEIEGIGYIERKLSYRTQIRDKGGAGGIVAEISLGTSTSTSPGTRGHFNDNTLVIGTGWGLDSYYVLPRAGTYMITFEIHTNNSSRLLTYFEMDVIRGGVSTQIWNDGNGKKDYYANTAYQFYSGDKLGLHFEFSGGSATTNITGTLRFIQF